MLDKQYRVHVLYLQGIRRNLQRPHDYRLEECSEMKGASQVLPGQPNMLH